MKRLTLPAPSSTMANTIKRGDLDQGDDQQASDRQIDARHPKGFDKHPIRVPVEADPHIHPAGHPAASTTVNNNFGVIFHASAQGAQVALNNSGQINQQQTHGDQVAPGFEPLAQAVALVMEGLAQVELTNGDRRDAEEAAAEVVTEVTTDHPNSSKIRRAVNVLKGVLAPIGAGLATATNAEVQEWARTAIDQLGAAL